ncbi:MAG: EamA family transporter [Polyangiaceae bacterium]|nr:EamA family transporter [Polyangiaceae bacterium]
MTWWMFALLSAAFAGATAILAKIGVQGVSSNLATAIRTGVVLIFAWGIVIANGEARGLSKVSGKTFLFLILSGIATGASWLAYFRALQLGPASKVAPIDKTSLAFTLTLAVVFLKEPLSWKLVLGVVLMIAGALVTII